MSRWFIIHQPIVRPRIRLICFPYAGGNAHVFYDWPPYLPQDVEVVAVQYPGRGNRVGERPISDCATMISLLRREIEPFLDLPFAFFGHSNGAIVSFELARRLQSDGASQQTHQFISAKRAPQLPRRDAHLRFLSKSDFISKLQKLGGTPPELLSHDGFMELMLPMLRADFALSETHVFAPAPPLRVSASLLHGTNDPDIPAEDMRPWAALFCGQVDMQHFDGNHFFINSHKQQLLSFIGKKLKELATTRDGGRRDPVDSSQFNAAKREVGA